MIPASFLKEGFLTADKIRSKTRRLLIGTDGWPNTGKTEFSLSAPGPIMDIVIDRGLDSVLDNADPPATRQQDVGYKVLPIPVATQVKQADYMEFWVSYRAQFYSSLANPDVRTVVVDGASDLWELQRLAAFGKLTQVMPINYTEVNSAYKAMLTRAFDSGKIVMYTHKLKDGYETKLDRDNKEVSIRSGKDKRQGFSDWGYLFHLQLRHLYANGKFGVRIMMCKVDTTLAGMELWGEDCCMQSLLSVVYPQVSLEEWGYK